MKTKNHNQRNISVYSGLPLEVADTPPDCMRVGTHALILNLLVVNWGHHNQEK